MPEIRGHRGARALRPENTLSGLAYALAIGVDALGFDVTLTADGGLILAHGLVVSAETILDTVPATEGDPDFPYVGKQWSALTLRKSPPWMRAVGGRSRRSRRPSRRSRPRGQASSLVCLDLQRRPVLGYSQGQCPAH
jgi:glycerophosphoryl diester phosphodiesterase